MDENITVFNKKDFFENEIRPKLNELSFLCGIHKVPFFYTACVANTKENGSEYVSDVVGPVGKEIGLYDDRISKHIAVAAGFDVVPSRAEIEMNVTDDLYSQVWEEDL